MKPRFVVRKCELDEGRVTWDVQEGPDNAPTRRTVANFDTREAARKEAAKRNAELDPCREPLPPPFPVGTRLRCKGRRHDLRYGRPGVVVRGDSDRYPEDWIVVYAKGLEVTVDEVRPGRRGTGRMVDLDDGEDPFPDATRDGYSVYHVEGSHGRCIFAEDADDWEVLS